MAINDPYSGSGTMENTGGSTGIGSNVDDLKRRAADAAGQVKDKASEIGRSTKQSLDRGIDSAADALTSGANSLRSSAQGTALGNYANRAADTMERAGSYMRDHDVADMVGDIEGAVRRNPGPSLLIAAAFGFLLGTAIKGSNRSRY